MNTVSTANKVYFKNLDSIRFIAAFMVFMRHVISPSYEYLPIKGTFIERLLNTIGNGQMGVSIFFVLSGFLITYLLIDENETEGRISLKNFYMRRVLRIWPLYFLVIFFTFLFYPFLKSLMGMNNPLGSRFIYHLLFLSNFDVIHIIRHCSGSDALSQNITWSVSVEEQFYLFWPLIFVFLPRRFWVYSILTVIAGSILFRVLNYDQETVLYFNTLSVLLDLGIGGLVAYLAKTNVRILRFFEGTKAIHHFLFFLLAFILVFCIDDIYSLKFGNAVGRIFTSVSFALVIAAQAFTKTNSALDLGKMSFASRWGKYTYGIYLIHPIAMTLVDVAARVLHLPQNSFASVFSLGLVTFVLTLLASKLSYTYYESRFLRLKKKFS